MADLARCSTSSGLTSARPSDRAPSVLLRRPAHLVVAMAMAIGLLIGGTPSASAVTATSPQIVRSPTTEPTPRYLVLSIGTDGVSPGTCPATNTKSFAKTKFVLHSGLAFGAFHRYLYKPFRAGTFAKGASGRLKAILKAGAASAFIVHEVRLASQDVEANPTLCRVLAAPLKSFSSSVSGAVKGLGSGSFSAITKAQSSLRSAESSSARKGSPIKENPNPTI